MSTNKKAMYAGTFDLFTKGHADIVNRALDIFDELTILLAISSNKNPLFSKDQRCEMLRELYRNEPRVKVDFCQGLIVDFAKEKQIKYIVRGLRPLGDFEAEFQMASMNRKLCSEIDTIFLTTSSEHYFISSTFVKEVLSHGGDIKEFVPKEIYTYLSKLGKV